MAHFSKFTHVQFVKVKLYSTEFVFVVYLVVSLLYLNLRLCKA